MIQAREFMLNANKTGPKTQWFHKISDKVPYNRSDTLRVTIERAMKASGEEVDTVNKRANKFIDKAKYMFVRDRVYPKSWGKFEKTSVNGIPHVIELDRKFGFLIGAYLAEGCLTDFQVCIANNNENYRKMATEWSDSQKISNRLNVTKSTTICIHSTILSHLLYEMCGEDSYNKRVPEFAYSAPDEFIEGLLDAYLCGDGTISEYGSVRAISRSIKLRDGISLLMTRFGIITKLSMRMELNKKDKKDPTGVLMPIYMLSTRVCEVSKFKDIITAIDYKQKRIQDNIHKEEKTRPMLKDVFLDPVISIEPYQSKYPFVYDLTVETTRMMTVVNGIHSRDTFHYAGVSAKNVTLGVPRLKELINVTKKLKTPSLTMYEDSAVRDITSDTGKVQMVETIRSNLEYKLLQDIIKSSDILDHDSSIEFVGDADIINFYRDLYMFDEKHLPDTNKCLRLSFEAKDLEYIDMSITEVAKILIKDFDEQDIKVICSDDNDPTENLFIRIYICNEDPVFVEDTLRKIEIHCMNVKLKGCESIDRVYTREVNITKWDPEKGYYKDKQWLLETEGTNLIGSMEIKGIDHTRTITNDIMEICEVFGIEAARQALLNELRSVLSFDGSYVNYRHLDILVDTMTCRGSLTAITRHGINRVMDVGVLTKASFEETVEILTDAAAFGELDQLKGISDNIMLGQLVPAGTGIIDVLYDNDMKRSVYDVLSNETIQVPDHVVSKFIPTRPDYDRMASYDLVFA
jgi:DNA-directed RNA polymerase beta' subunit